jgi:DNA-directed RNA polymerase specialized sigma24 family protein
MNTGTVAFTVTTGTTETKCRIFAFPVGLVQLDHSAGSSRMLIEISVGDIGFCVDGEDNVDINATAIYIANYLRRSFPMVERDDIYQEIQVWIASHEEKIEEWLEDGDHGKNKLHRAMRNAGLKYCQEEKARVLGYKVDDLYYYDLGKIRDTLGCIWDEEAWTSPPQPVEEAKVKHKAVSEGNNYVTTLSDISRAVSQLPKGDQLVLKWFFHDGYSADEIAVTLSSSRSAVESRVHRLVVRLQRMLGGERPDVP